MAVQQAAFASARAGPIGADRGAAGSDSIGADSGHRRGCAHPSQRSESQRLREPAWCNRRPPYKAAR